MIEHETHRGMVAMLLADDGCPLNNRKITREETEILDAMQSKAVLNDIEVSKLREIWDAVCEKPVTARMKKYRAAKRAEARP
jgi:hypothetical protein